MVPALGGYPATANPAQVWTRRLCPECRISPTLSALRDYKSKMYWSSQSHLRRVAEPPAEFSNWRLGEAGGSAPCICQCMCQSSRSPAFNYRSSPSPSLQDNKPASWQAATARPAFLPPERAGRETGDFWFDSDRCCLRCFEHAAWTLSCQS